MRPHKVYTPPGRKFAAGRVALLSLAIILCGVALAPGAAQSPAKEEREVENTIPKHVPIRVRVKNPEKVKELKNEDWLVDLEIEVTNTGSRPIYHVGLSLHLPETEDAADGSIVGYYLSYGRIALTDLATPVESDDVPLRPGESCILKVPEDSATAWKPYRAKKNLPNPKKLKLLLSSLVYGDGTGLFHPDGLPLPNKDQSSAAPCRDATGRESLLRIPAHDPPRYVGRSSLSLLLPATLTPANFLPPSLTLAAPALKSSQHGCCPGTPKSR